MAKSCPNSGTRSQVARSQHTLLDNTGISRHPIGSFTRYKIIAYGKYLEVYEYEAPINVGRRSLGGRKPLAADDIYEILVNPDKKSNRSLEYKKRNTIRTKNRIRRLVQRNFDKVGRFTTLTFRDTHEFDLMSLKSCRPKFTGFIRRLRNHAPKIKYLAVPEFQKRGAVHYHLVSDMPYTPVETLRRLWPFGFLKINLIKDPSNVGVYIAKYVGKALMDNRYQNQRCFYASKNLLQPVVAYGEQLKAKVEAIKNKGFKPEYETTYQTEFYGTVKFSSYNLYKSPALQEFHD